MGEMPPLDSSLFMLFLIKRSMNLTRKQMKKTKNKKKKKKKEKTEREDRKEKAGL